MPDRMLKVLHAFAALADLGEEIAETTDFDEMVRSALHVVLGALGVRRGAVTEFDSHSGKLRFVASRGFGSTHPSEISISLSDATHANTVEAVKFNHALLEDQIKVQLPEWPLQNVTPLLVRGELVGVILLGAKASDESFTTEELELVRSLGRHIGVGLHNHRLLREVEHRAEENRQLYDDLRAIYKDTVRAFAVAIDCKDKYTQGHSQRVGKYSEIIAREMGWSDEEVEGISIAGYLHDIGKLVVDRDIINAPYKIDAKQSSELNRHPAAGYEILRPINHPYADIPLMARYHHERIDGRGYPEGLSGEQIPLGAKIVSLADSFDAMTTDRPYKRRRDFEEVVADFRRNSGKQFAPEVIVAFCRALLKEVEGHTSPRQIFKLLGKEYLAAENVAPLLQQLIKELETETTLVAGHS